MGSATLNGITSKLDYLKDLGVDAIWGHAVFSVSAGGFRIRRLPTMRRSTRCTETMKDFDRLVGEGKKRNVSSHSRFRGEPHFGSATSGFRIPNLRKLPSNRDLVHLARRQGARTSRRTTGFPRSACPHGSSTRKTNQYYYHYFYPEQPELELAQSRGGKGHAGRDALLVQARRFRIPARWPWIRYSKIRSSRTIQYCRAPINSGGRTWTRSTTRSCRKCMT